MNITNLEIKQENKFLDIIRVLNRESRQGEDTIFECRDLGLIHIWWEKGWRCKWFEPNMEFYDL